MVYLDYAAATPCDERVFSAMQPYLFTDFFNPSAAYKSARSVRYDLEAARKELARHLGAKPGEIYLTSGATESANLALRGVMTAFPDSTLAVCATEHASVLETARSLGATLIPVDCHGLVTEAALEAVIADSTVLVSIGYVNSETGAQQQLTKLGQVLQRVRARRLEAGNHLPLYFHTDATQAAGSAELHTSRLGVDLLTLSAAKLYGPKQAGLLFVRAGTKLEAQQTGGGQEGGIRSGTEDVAAAVGFARALQLASERRSGRSETVRALRDEFERLILDGLKGPCRITAEKRRAPHISHFTLPSCDGETLLFLLDEAGVMVATGAACAANKAVRSHVLVAMGMSETEIQGSLRCSFSHLTTMEDVQYAANCLIKAVKKAGEIS